VRLPKKRKKKKGLLRCGLVSYLVATGATLEWKPAGCLRRAERRNLFAERKKTVGVIISNTATPRKKKGLSPVVRMQNGVKLALCSCKKEER